jgi:hypothetical protein
MRGSRTAGGQTNLDFAGELSWATAMNDAISSWAHLDELDRAGALHGPSTIASVSRVVKNSAYTPSVKATP